MLQPILTTWNNLSAGKRVSAIVGISVTVLTMFLLVQLAMAPGFALLYGNLGPSQAGEVISSLDRQSARYQVRGSAIYVEEGRRDELRMLLASEGLPPNSVSGYELLDKLSGFGTTSQMFDAAYLRAIEGELARSIMASSFAREARVHISRGALSPFQIENSITASVFVRPSSFEITKENAKALKYLVASSISGLSTEDVAIIDANTGKVVEQTASDFSANGENERAAALQIGVTRLLEAHVGRGNVKVEINLEADHQTESIVERKFDPNGRVAISTDNQEISHSSSGPSGGAVTIASNVPSGNAGNTGAQSTSQNSEIRERTNFEVSEVERQIEIAPGSIKRISVAVLVEGVYELDANGVQVWRPRTQTEVEDLRELVQSAVGYRSDRGDLITIKSLKFESLTDSEMRSNKSIIEFSQLDVMTIIQLFVLSAVILILGLFVLKPILSGGSRGNLNQGLFNDTSLAAAITDEGEGGNNQKIESLELEPLPPLGDFNSPMAVIDDFDFSESPNDGGTSIAQLKNMIETRQTDSVEILRSWLETSETETET